ncbi:MAG: hypothetical protein JJE36_03735 [Coriobacteriia bacterium]|nr:hypothetical protein [Coriobacteriia bacterium]
MALDKRATLGVVFGLCALVAAGGFVWGITTSSERDNRILFERYGGDIVEVCVATKDIKAGELISDKEIKTKSWVASLLPEKAVLGRNRLAIRNKRASEHIVKGEPISLLRVKDNANKMDEIPEGCTAITLQTDPVRALGGQAKAGMYVTLLDTSDTDRTSILAEHVEVLVSSTETDSKRSGTLIGSSSAPDITWITLSIPDELVAQVAAASSANATYIVMPKNSDAKLSSLVEATSAIELAPRTEK